MSLLLRVKALAQAIGSDIKAINAKLTGVATGATKNSTDAQLRDRATHTGTQAVGTITGLGSAATRNVGTANGNIMEVGAFGIGKNLPINFHPAKVPTTIAEAAESRFGRFEPAYRGIPTFTPYVQLSGYSLWGRIFVTGMQVGNLQAFIEGGHLASNKEGQVEELMHTGNTLNIGKAAVTARSAMGLFTDASGVVTDGSGRISNDMSSFLSSLTYAQMKTKLGVPTWDEVIGKPATYPSNWDNVASKPEQATRWPTWDEVTGKPDVGGGGGGFTTAPVYVPAFNLDPVDAIDHGVSAPAIVSPSKKVGFFATDSKVVLFNTTTSPHGDGDSANVEVSPAVVQMTAENSVAGIFAGIFITSEGIIISGITNTDGDIVSTTDTGSVSLQDLAARVAALEARS